MGYAGSQSVCRIALTLAEATPNVHFVGRLATYKYYNQDQVVAQALSVYAKLQGTTRSKLR